MAKALMPSTASGRNRRIVKRRVPHDEAGDQRSRFRREQPFADGRGKRWIGLERGLRLHDGAHRTGGNLGCSSIKRSVVVRAAKL